MHTSLIDLHKIAWWEVRRIIFNIVMAISGSILLLLIQWVKPVSMHLFFKTYVDLIFFYGLIANLAYTAAYVYVLLISKKFIELNQIQETLKQFTYKAILVIGLAINLLAGLGELLFRIAYM